MTLSNITIDQLQTATKEQILTFIFKKLSAMTKLQLCRFILRVQDVDTDNAVEIPDPVTDTKDNRGTLTQEGVIRDEMGNKVKTQKADYTYYHTGEVHTITLTELDNMDHEVSRKVIEHFTDGRQPICQP